MRFGEARVDVIVRGELDVATAPLLDRTFARAEEASPAVLAVDLAGVTFVDGAGLRALLSAARRGARLGRRVRVSHASEPLRRLFELTAVDYSLDVLPT